LVSRRNVLYQLVTVWFMASCTWNSAPPRTIAFRIRKVNVRDVSGNVSGIIKREIASFR
jgi:hypothetical protein